ncbi:MAG: phosphatidate cytidylyltransferase [Armatimonadota bacterium]|jgi:phosphatidate cytidylyltransferase
MSPWFYLIVLIEVPILLGLAYVGGWWLFAAIAFATLMGMGELYSALIVRGQRPEAAVGYLCALLMLMAAEFGGSELWAELMILTVFVTVAAPLSAQFARTGEPGRIRDAATTTMGALYVALPMSFIMLLCKFDIPLAVTGESDGQFKARLGALLLMAAAVWISDTAAWGIGKLFGRTRMTPKLSPNKTWEGAAAGTAGAVLATLAVGAWVGLPFGHGVALGLLLAAAAQIGDLAESVIKRDLQMKDFGTLLGPHGGMLDTFDGVLFAAPVAWFYLQLFV